MPHFELNSVEQIGRSLKNTIYVDTMEKVSFPLTNSGFSPGPKIYLDKRLLQDSRQVKGLYKTLRRILLKFYIEEFGIVLTYHMSQIEEIKYVGIDSGGNFRLISPKPAPIKKKLPKLTKKMIKKGKFSKLYTLEEAGLMDSGGQPPAVGDYDKSVSHGQERSRVEFLRTAPVSFLNMKSSKSMFHGLEARKGIKRLHLITSKVNQQIAVCKCNTSHKLHSKLIMMAQSLLFIINNSIDTIQTPWYSMPDFVALLLEDIMRIASIMRFLGPLFTKFNSIKEYYKYSKKNINYTQKRHYLKFFSDKRSNYQTKFLLQMLAVSISFIGNIFNSLVDEFQYRNNASDLATPIEILNASDYKANGSKKKMFSKQDLIIISEYIDKLPNKNNCVLYQKAENISINQLSQKSVFSLC
ncbi:putative signal peptide protein [Cryptosporidium canis]|nr:putative signal peptide protein [Cryptosporidium canis]